MEENARHWLHGCIRMHANTLPHTVTEFLQKDRIPIFSYLMCPENQRSSLAHGIVLKVWIVCFIYLCIYLFVAVGLVYMSIYMSLPSLGLLPV